MKSILVFLSFFLFIGLACAVSYNVINQDLELLGLNPCYGNYIPTTFTFSQGPVDPNANGDAAVSITVAGDFANYGESLDITCEGFSFGPFLDLNTANDIWTDAVGGYGPDQGNDCAGPITSTAIIPLAQLTPMVADGNIDCTLTAGYEVECFCAAVSVLLQFDYPVAAPGGGDPYFLGFDDQVFKFDGNASHVYNLISSPQLQFNARFDRGRSDDGLYTMRSVVREVGVLWDKYNILFSIDHSGLFNASIFDGLYRRELSADREQAMLGEVKIDWMGKVNYTRENHLLHMSPHQVLYQIHLSHPQWSMQLYAVDLVLNQIRFYFVDMQVELKDRSDCYEGVWGRTTCVSSLSKFAGEEYDLHGNLLGCNSLHNLFQC